MKIDTLKFGKITKTGKRILLHLFWCDIGYENLHHAYGISIKLLVSEGYLSKVIKGLEAQGLVSHKVEECRRDYYLTEGIKAYLQELYDKTEMKYGREILSRTRFVEGWF